MVEFLSKPKSKEPQTNRNLMGVIKDVFKRSQDYSLISVAAGVAFYLTLSIFPALLAIGALIGIILSDDQVREQFAALTRILPDALEEVLSEQINMIIASDQGQLGFALALSLLFLAYSASAGTQAILRAVNISYGEGENRNFLRLRLFSLAATLVGFLVAALILVLLGASGDILSALGVPPQVAGLIDAARWPILGLIFALVLMVLYRYAPEKREPRWILVAKGAVAGTLLWIAVTALFFFYVRSLASFGEIYGALAGVIMLMLWFYLSALAVLIGGALNASLSQGHPRDPCRDWLGRWMVRHKLK